MKTETRCCARSRCRKAFTVRASEPFITCPECRLPWRGTDLGAAQQLPHARERKGYGDADTALHTRLGDHNEVVT